MKNIVLGFISVIVFTTVIFSCSSDENENDKEPPYVSGIKVADNDTIILSDNNILYFNRSIDPIIDTLVAGRYIPFSARFQDNTAISSFKIRICFDSISQVPPVVNSSDTTIHIVKTWHEAFGKQDTIISWPRQQITKCIQIPDSVQVQRNNRRVNLAVTEGFYFFDIFCIDVSGNQMDSIRRIAKIVYRKNLIEDLH